MPARAKLHNLPGLAGRSEHTPTHLQVPTTNQGAYSSHDNRRRNPDGWLNPSVSNIFRAISGHRFTAESRTNRSGRAELRSRTHRIASYFSTFVKNAFRESCARGTSRINFARMSTRER